MYARTVKVCLLVVQVTSSSSISCICSNRTRIRREEAGLWWSKPLFSCQKMKNILSHHRSKYLNFGSSVIQTTNKKDKKMQYHFHHFPAAFCLRTHKFIKNISLLHFLRFFYNSSVVRNSGKLTTFKRMHVRTGYQLVIKLISSLNCWDDKLISQP